MNISINVLMLDNKRFTKSVYKQLPYYEFKPEILNGELGTNLIGYVKDDSYVGFSLLVSKNNRLIRYSFPFFLDTFGDCIHNNVSSEEEMYLYRDKIFQLNQIFISC